MVRISLYLLLACLPFGVKSQTITINSIEDEQNFSVFDDRSVIGISLSQPNSATLRISTEIFNPEKHLLQVADSNNNFSNLPPKGEVDNGLQSFFLNNLQIINGTNKFKFRILYDGEDGDSRTYFSLGDQRTIAAEKNSNTENSIVKKSGIPCGCNVQSFDTTINSDYKRLPENNFNEDVANYSDKTIVYVFDYNKDASKRIWYKIRRVKHGKNNVTSSNLAALYKEWDDALLKKDNVKKDSIRKEIDTFKKIASELGYHLETVPVNFNKENLKPGNDVHVLVVNANKYVYDLKVQGTIIELDSEPPPLLQSLFIGDSTILARLIDNVLGNIQTSSFREEEVPLIDCEESLSNQINCFLQRYNELTNLAWKAYDPCSVFEDCQKVETKDLEDLLDKISISMQGLEREVVNSRKELVDKKQLQASCKANAAALAKAKRDLELEKVKEKKDPVAIKKLEFDVEDLTSIAAKCDPEMTASIRQLEEELSPYNALLQLFDQLPKAKSDIKRYGVFINDMIEKAQTDRKNINVGGNYIELDFEIKTKDSMRKVGKGYFDHDSLYKLIPVLWNPLVSFSSGSFLCLGNALQTKTYEWQRLPNSNNVVVDSSGYVLAEKGYSPPVMGFSAFINYGLNPFRGLGFGLSGGVGITIEPTPRVAYLGGISIMPYSRNRQVVLSLGVAGMQTDILDNNLRAAMDQKLVYAKNNLQTISYYKEFRTSYFASISYTLYNTNRIKRKKTETNEKNI